MNGKARDGQWLKEFGRRLTKSMRDELARPLFKLTAPSQISLRESNADGWYVELGSIKGDRGGAIQVWLDRWPRTNKRKLWFGYKGSNPKTIESIARVGDLEFGRATKLYDGAYSYDKGERAWLLKKPLNTWNSPVAESYSGTWGFYGLYLRRTPLTSAPPSQSLVLRARRFLVRLSRAILAQAESERYSARSSNGSLEGNPKYPRHRRYERSSALAEAAKLRDGYTCSVCGIHFEQLYGALGKQFAEAHHLIPLSQLRKARRNSSADLITVCANCHRMLHRLPASRADHRSLRKHFTARWPK